METAHSKSQFQQDFFFSPFLFFSCQLPFFLPTPTYLSLCLPISQCFLHVLFPFCTQSNSLLPESLRNSDKRRNGPDFSNDAKKRKVDDKDSSHYVRNCFYFGASHFYFKLGTKVYTFVPFIYVSLDDLICSH